jgi:hypothetical protein
MPDRSQSERRKALKRDGGRCVKCGSRTEVAGHHLIPLFRGGADTAANMTSLCSLCHAEWHMLETYHPINFEMWRAWPPLGMLLTLLSREETWPEDMSAREFHSQFLAAIATIREMEEE